MTGKQSTECPKKVSHYQESSLNRIKTNFSAATSFLINFEYKHKHKNVLSLYYTKYSHWQTVIRFSTIFDSLPTF